MIHLDFRIIHQSATASINYSNPMSLAFGEYYLYISIMWRCFCTLPLVRSWWDLISSNCPTISRMGLFITSHLTRDLVPPSVADLIPGTVRTEDFDEESGSVDVAPVIEISRLILSNDLAIRRGTFIEGKAKFGALIDVICDEGHSVKTLTESDLKIIVGEGYRNF